MMTSACVQFCPVLHVGVAERLHCASSIEHGIIQSDPQSMNLCTTSHDILVKTICFTVHCIYECRRVISERWRLRLVTNGVTSFRWFPECGCVRMDSMTVHRY